MIIRFPLQIIVSWVFLFCLLFRIPIVAQVGDLGSLDIPQKGKVKGITSFRTNNSMFLAVWYVVPSKEVAVATQDSLHIFERVENRYREVFQFTAEASNVWEHLLSFDSSGVPGVVLFSSSGISDRGPAIVIGLVGNNFGIVYRGDESEFVDINADGIPEILESVWPDGDGDPKTTTIHVWNGKVYKPLLKVRWRDRFGQAVRTAVEKAFRKGVRQ
jgi:hypothetical protein